MLSPYISVGHHKKITKTYYRSCSRGWNHARLRRGCTVDLVGISPSEISTWLALGQLESESPSLAMVLELEESLGFPFWCFRGFPGGFAATRQEMCGFTDLDYVAVHLQPPMESILCYPISALYKFLQIPKMKFLVRYKTAIKGVGVSIAL